MAKNSADHSLWMAVWPTATTLIGLILLALGITWTVADKPGGGLTPEMVQEFNDAGSALESASSQRQRQKQGKEIPQDAEEAHAYDTAFKRYANVKEEMEQAMSSSNNRTFWMKIAGGVLTTLGVCGLLLNKN